MACAVDSVRREGPGGAGAARTSMRPMLTCTVGSGGGVARAAARCSARDRAVGWVVAGGGTGGGRLGPMATGGGAVPAIGRVARGADDGAVGGAGASRGE